MRTNDGRCWLIVFLTFFFAVSCNTELAAFEEHSALLAWSERVSGGNYQIRLSRYDGQSWAEPFLLSSGSREIILPAIGTDNENNIWVVWTELRGVHGTIHYRAYIDEKWTAPAQLETLTTSDLAPSLAVEADGRAWLAFSGSDGMQDDVYAVQWLGGHWSRPEKVHPDNDTPDVLPGIFIGSAGHPVVSWQCFDGNQYRPCFSSRTKTGWSARSLGKSAQSFFVGRGLPEAATEEKNQLVKILPPFLEKSAQGVLHLGGDETISIRLGGE